MKNGVKMLSCTAMLICAVTAQAAAPAAANVRSAESEAAQYLLENGYMKGDENGDLLLDETITRAEFAVLLAESGYISEAEGNENSFSDVSEGHWAYKSIKRACAAGIISGFPDGTFRPDEPVTYEQALKMAVSMNMSYGTYPESYVAEAIESGTADNVHGMIGENLSRGNAAVLIRNMIENKDNAEDYKMPLYSYSSSGSGGGGVTGHAAPIGGGSSLYAYKAESEAIQENAGYSDFIPAPYPIYSGNSEEYENQEENIFKKTVTSPLSTFSIDVDTASYSNLRRFITSGRLPESGTMRIEELINYFDYDLPLPDDGEPFSVISELHKCPWNDGNKLCMISLKGDEFSEQMQKGSNLVFLIDTSGSMYSYNKLPLVQRSIGLLLDNLKEEDTVSIVTYAGSAGVALEPTPVREREKITNALNSLRAYGSTAGAAGIETAYRLAEENKVDGNNRIILCTDGDFNVGMTSNSSLEEMISKKRESGIFLTVLGFGMGNYKDNRMEMLADCGNGNYAYIDTLKEAKKVLADDLNKTIYTIAKDVKLQIEFNPAYVSEYRLIGYENRKLENEDFENDNKDAGEIGAGHSVTVFYEIVPETGKPDNGLIYQDTALIESDDLMCVNIRYKKPDEEESNLIKYSVSAEENEEISDNYNFASAVAEYGMLINKSEFCESISYNEIIKKARNSLGEDKYGIRNEFVQLVDLAGYLSNDSKMETNLPW